MILVRRPSPDEAETYRVERLGMALPCPPAERPPAGFRLDSFTRVIGSGGDAFRRARSGLQGWAAHRGSGVDVVPPEAELMEGTTVAIVTRQLGLWVLAACRVETVIDERTTFGFVYATLPGHPVCGYESFIVRLVDDEVRFDIEAVSKPGVLLARVGEPITRQLQRRGATAYLAALAGRVQQSAP